MTTKLLGRTYNEQLRDIMERYRESGQEWPATAREIAEWAIANGYYTAHKSKLIAKAAEEFATAMREEHHTDPQGRRVRTLHAARVTRRLADGTRQQMMLWNDIRTADTKFMERAFQLRRRQIVGDCRQLKNDLDSYNDNRTETQKQIQMEFDFTEDLRELEQPTEYRPNRPR